MQKCDLRLGAQSFSFREFGFEESITQLKKLGLDAMEFCCVHFPPDADDPGFPAVQETLRREHVLVPSYGVSGFGGDAAANRKIFEFGKALGVDVLTADPAPDAFESLDALTQEFGISIAIHNHGPGARYDKVSDVLDAVSGCNPLIGACLDTGHFVRSGVKPEEAIQQFGDRLISVHIKDWICGGEEQIPGEGDLDLCAVAGALKTVGFSGPVMLEYENSPENPVPDMIEGLANWRAAMDTQAF